MLAEEDKATLLEIELRWRDKMHSVCASCMYNSIRHWDRNEGWCEEEGAIHPDRYDGDVFATAGQDIKCLLGIVKKMIHSSSVSAVCGTFGISQDAGTPTATGKTT